MTAFVYEPPSGGLEVLFDDPDIVAISKPSGLLSVPGRLAQHQDSALFRMAATQGSLKVVHRLDMDTSGVMLFAKNNRALKSLHQQFAERSVTKIYYAWAAGKPTDHDGLVDQPLICDWPNRPRQKVDLQDGKPSQTAWKVIKSFGSHSEFELSPITGRSHQLRVHLAHLGHPILGDRLYGNGQESARRLMLHAASICFQHPAAEATICIRDESENRLKEGHLVQ